MAMTKIALDKNQAMTLLDGFMKQFQASCNRPNPPHIEEFEKFLSPNFQLHNNGTLACKNLQEYVNRLTKLQKKFSRIEISSTVRDPIISENRMAISYDINLTGRNGQKSQVHVIALVRVDDHNHIVEWSQVVHEKGREWDQ